MTGRVELAPMPNGKAFIHFLNALEMAIPPETCQVFGLNYWPIIRFAINAKRKTPRFPSEEPIPKIGLFSAARIRINGIFASAPQQNVNELDVMQSYPSENFAHLQQADVLFLARAKQYQKHYPGHAIQFLTDGLRKIVGTDVRYLTLVDKDPRAEDESYLCDAELLPKSRKANQRRLLLPTNSRDLQARVAVLSKLAEINAEIERLGFDCTLNEREILDQIGKTVARIGYFLRVFERVQPKVVYIVSFTGAYHICAAAKLAGIPLVDIQHGSMHRNHPIAANWKNVPVGGYELLPDIFWCWSERTAGYVNETFTAHHRAIVGGNPKAALERRLFGEPEPDSEPAETKGRIRVLVALQYGKDKLIGPHIREVYQETKDQIDWCFRLHPMGMDRMSEAMQELELSREQLVQDSRKPLHHVLPSVDYVLTDASTIVYEALDCGIRSAVWSAKGAAIFDDLVESGQIDFAVDAETLRRVLSRITTSASQRGLTARDTEEERIKSAFLQLLHVVGLKS